jgi:hypothetical protein
MLSKLMTRSIGLAAALAAAGSLAACAPIEVRMDGPLPGATATLSEEQPLAVRLSNVSPGAGEWVLAEGEFSAVTFEGKEVRPPADGVRQLETFRFAGLEPGVQQLTFNYVQSTGEITDQIPVEIVVR